METKKYIRFLYFQIKEIILFSTIDIDMAEGEDAKFILKNISLRYKLRNIVQYK